MRLVKKVLFKDQRTFEVWYRLPQFPGVRILTDLVPRTGSMRTNPNRSDLANRPLRSSIFQNHHTCRILRESTTDPSTSGLSNRKRPNRLIATPPNFGCSPLEILEIAGKTNPPNWILDGWVLIVFLNVRFNLNCIRLFR